MEVSAWNDQLPHAAFDNDSPTAVAAMEQSQGNGPSSSAEAKTAMASETQACINFTTTTTTRTHDGVQSDTVFMAMDQAVAPIDEHVRLGNAEIDKPDEKHAPPPPPTENHSNENGRYQANGVPESKSAEALDWSEFNDGIRRLRSSSFQGGSKIYAESESDEDLDVDAEPRAKGPYIVGTIPDGFQYINDLELVSKCKVPKNKDKYVMCDCTYDPATMDPSEACGDDCLNRMMMIECRPGRCPCKARCNNRQFQRGSVCRLEVFDAGPKGRGLRTLEAIKSGQFVIEYVGEVVNHKEFQRRFEHYNTLGHKHFYFMSLSGDQYVDAQSKGNVSRFLNHSCAPNCETQKWQVGGEMRVGFFATRDITGGEELTFDYRLERYGEEEQKCFCGAAECRGALGGKKNQLYRSSSTGSDERGSRRESGAALTRAFTLRGAVNDAGELLNGPEATRAFARAMIIAEESDHLETCLRALEITPTTSPALDDFVRFARGLSVIKVFYNLSCEMKKAADTPKSWDWERRFLRVLDGLPVKNRQQVEKSNINDIMDGLVQAPDTEVAEMAKALRGKWTALPTELFVPKKTPNRSQGISEVAVPPPYRTTCSCWERNNLQGPAGHGESYEERTRSRSNEFLGERDHGRGYTKEQSSRNRHSERSPSDRDLRRGSERDKGDRGHQREYERDSVDRDRRRGSERQTGGRDQRREYDRDYVDRDRRRGSERDRSDRDYDRVRDRGTGREAGERKPSRWAPRDSTTPATVAYPSATVIGYPSAGWASTNMSVAAEVSATASTAGGFVNPPQLPPGWASATDPSTGTPYYFQIGTNVTQWEMPIVAPSAQPLSSNIPPPEPEKPFPPRIPLSERPDLPALPGGQVKPAASGTIRIGGIDVEIPPPEPQTSKVTADDEMVLDSPGSPPRGKRAADDKEDASTQRKTKHKKEREKMSVQLSEKELAELKKTFRDSLSATVVKQLAKYQDEKCKTGRITNKDDFKHMARKLTHVLLRKHEKSGKPFIWTDTRKEKVKHFIKDHMKKYGPAYVRNSAADKEMDKFDADGDGIG